MSKKVILFFKYMAYCFLAICLVFHLLTFLPELRTSNFTLLPLLFVSVFPPFVVAILVSVRKVPKKSNKDFVKTALLGAPKILKGFLVVVAVYVFFNFFFSLIYLNKGGLQPNIVNNEYVLESKGKIKEVISEEQYYKHQAYLFRGMSGHMLLFHFMSIALLSAALSNREKEGQII